MGRSLSDLKVPCARCEKRIAHGYSRSVFGPLVCKACLTTVELAEVEASKAKAAKSKKRKR